jgi:hypothetical protein
MGFIRGLLLLTFQCRILKSCEVREQNRENTTLQMYIFSMNQGVYFSKNQGFRSCQTSPIFFGGGREGVLSVQMKRTNMRNLKSLLPRNRRLFFILNSPFLILNSYCGNGAQAFGQHLRTTWQGVGKYMASKRACWDLPTPCQPLAIYLPAALRKPYFSLTHRTLYPSPDIGCCFLTESQM